MTDPSPDADVLTDPFLKGIPVTDGLKLLDRCVLYAKIGQGGMGAVYRGRHLNLDIDVAVKCLKPDLSESSTEFVQRFQREARVAAAINNEHLVRVFDVAESSGLHYLIMEYIAGETARERLRRKGSLAIDEALTIAIGAAKGLAVAHAKGLVHRDVKPDNIMIAQDGAVKLADLGLVRASESLDTLETKTGMVMGTPRYMPPEQFENARGVGPAGDVWAMGAVLYFLLTGEDGIERGSLPEVMRRVLLEGFPRLQDRRPEMPAELDAIISRCTAPNPSERFAHAGALVEKLEAFLASLGGETILADQSAGAGSRHNLVSPPPAQTIAKLSQTLTEKPTEVVASKPAQEPEVPKAVKKSAKPVLPIILAVVIIGLLSLLLWDRLGTQDQGSQSAEVAQSDGSPRAAEPKDEPATTKDLETKVEVEVEEPRSVRTKPEGRESSKAETLPDLAAPLLDEPVSDLVEAAPAQPVAAETEPTVLDWARPMADQALHPQLQLPIEVVHLRTGIQMVLINAGEFQRGASPGDDGAWPDEQPQHRVRLTKPFYMSKFEVTNEQFRRFKSDHNSGRSKDGNLDDDDQPVVRVSWLDAEAFCKNFALMLPSEAQWEFAARAGTTSAYYGDLEASAWMSRSGVVETQEGGRKGANDWMLFDMLGNVDEWCADYFSADAYKRFEDRVAEDPTGPSRGQLRVVRGGNYLSSPRNCRVSARNRSPEKNHSPETGFRVIRYP